MCMRRKNETGFILRWEKTSLFEVTQRMRFFRKPSFFPKKFGCKDWEISQENMPLLFRSWNDNKGSFDKRTEKGRGISLSFFQ